MSVFIALGFLSAGYPTVGFVVLLCYNLQLHNKIISLSLLICIMVIIFLQYNMGEKTFIFIYLIIFIHTIT